MRNADRNLFVMSILAWAVVLGACLAGLGTRPGFGVEPEEEAKKLIVMVEGKLGDEDTWGAGVIVAAKSDTLYIVTANHVVRKGLNEAKDLRVMLLGDPRRLDAKLLEHADSDLDLAVLYVEGISELNIPVKDLPFDRLGNVGALRKGDPVYHVGNPLHQSWRSNTLPGAVSEEISGTEVRFEASRIEKGSSGGGLFDKRWTLVGLVRADEPLDAVAVRIDNVLATLKLWNIRPDLTRPGAERAGLVAEWHFEGDAKDSGGNRIDGRVEGTAFVEGKLGKALAFDGIDDSVDFGTGGGFLDFGTGDFSIEFWMNYQGTTVHPNFAYVMGKTSGGRDTPGFFVAITTWGAAGTDYVVDIDTTTSATWMSGSAETGGTHGGGTYFPNTWYHFTFVRSGNTWTIYTNGIQSASRTNGDVGRNVTNSSNLTFSKQSFEPRWLAFKGLVDELRIYNRSLSADEVKANYEVGSP